ncbi:MULTISPECIES: VOC family protein [unclassified Rhodococcus (in: high G+C Gram-positive bacteria)]|jgi:catechol-2,3-dioxygenase|uniref:VOC family protein n=1 Tax=unclassified Rhodococcus (in: high G+C Gram-positive bacteria) TaxID=192944 RepID=UPI000480F731|nr:MULTISPECIES: VOC family protein [unclassified Rhodococcus (in: high G+C Gram-positive bacteria)]KQU35985.1 glyoxalase [Rhodococcus sp. Leaf225]KQU48533.1 glyoxalase [Rhodococcus sp. Leaf258]MBY6677246.1 VOC family protein [Rhodococcus sp. BP-332]MBY6680239.1 VOC family protein [Rhodococcus sp. BP-316]MBY6684606.1 VOC family protein [Rhodococcus sp. BP-288]
MAISRLNHAVLYVRDAQRSARFYSDVLGFRVVMSMGDRAVFVQAPDSTNDHDLGLFSVGDGAGASPAGRSTVGLYHLAWEVQTLSDLVDLREKLATAGALVGASDHSTSKSLYGQDPDGIEFEIAWLVPADRIDDAVLHGRSSIAPLDLDAEIARYGADTTGGIGVSTAALS